MSYLKNGALFKGLLATPTAGAITTLTKSSKQLQVFTGTSAQTVVMPDATTLATPRRFDIRNESTQAITVNANGGGLLATVPANSQRYFLLTDKTTAPGVWQVGGVVSAGAASVSTSDKLNLLSGMSSVSASTDNIESRILDYRPEEVGGDYFLTKASLPVAKSSQGNFNLNGFGYSAAGFTGSSGSPTLVQTVYRLDDANNYWLSRANTPSAARIDIATFNLNSFGYLVGGDPTGGARSAATEQYNDSTNTWATKTSIATATDEMLGFSLNGYGYTGGGSVVDNVGLTTFQQYSDSANAWYIRAPLPAGRAALDGTGVVLNGFGYTAGGYSSGYQSTTYRYSDEINTWMDLTSAPMAFSKGHASSGLANGSMLFAAGNDGVSPQSTVQQYNDSTGSWRTTKPLSSGRFTPGRMIELAGSTYIVGGSDSSNAFTTVEQYINFSYMSLGVLKRTSAVPTSILVSTLVNGINNNLPVQVRTDGDNWKSFYAGADSVLRTSETLRTKFQTSGLVYVIGGENSTGATTLSSSEYYNPITTTWTPRANLNTARRAYGSATIDGLSYFFGGDPAVSAVEYYDEIKNSFTTRASVLSPTVYYPCSDQLLGYGWFFGGFASGSAVATTKRYDATIDSFLAKGSMNTARDSACGWNLLDRLFAAGGEDVSATQLSSTESYNPITDVWTLKSGTLSSPRYLAVGATINGYGYIVGGTPSTTVQKYDQAADSWGTVASIPGTTGNPICMRSAGFMYAMGGANGSVNTAATQIYNPAANTWATSTNMNTARGKATSNLAPGAYYQYEVRVGLPAFYAGLGTFTWSTKTPMPQLQSSGYTATVGGKLYTMSYINAGGIAGNSYRYSPILDTWERETDYPLNIIGQSVSSTSDSLNGLAYISNGTNGGFFANTYSFNIDTHVFTGLANIPTATSAPEWGGLNGYMYCASGHPTPNPLGMTQYNPYTNTWTSKAALSNRHYAGAGGSYNGFFYAMGDAAPASLNDRYDDAANSWLSRANILGGAYNQGIFLLGGRMVLTGGDPGPVATSYAYSDTINAWIAVQSQPAVILAQQGGTISGTGYLAGGQNASVYLSTNIAAVDSVKAAVLGLALEVK